MVFVSYGFVLVQFQVQVQGEIYRRYTKRRETKCYTSEIGIICALIAQKIEKGLHQHLLATKKLVPWVERRPGVLWFLSLSLIVFAGLPGYNR
jgi:hypothetical protein